MKALNVFLALLVSALIAVGVFEGGLRLIGMGPPKTLNRFDSALGWTKKPGLQVTRKTGEFEVEFEMNDLGLRDDADQSEVKSDGMTRVLCLGDSFTLGFGVNRPDLFVDHLESWWKAEGRQVDVVNAGTEAYATDQEVVWLQEHGQTWSPDVVLLFAYENDLYYNGQDHYLLSSKPRFSPAGVLETGELQDTGAKSFFQRTAIGNLFGSKPQLDTFRPAGGSREVFKEFGPLFKQQPDFMGDALARTSGALKAFKATCDQLGAKGILVTIPSHSAVHEDFAQNFGKNFLGVERAAWDPNKPVQAFLNAAKQAGVPTIDPSARLRALQSAGTELYHTVDFHLNPAGNRALAEILHEELANLGDFPAPSQALALADVAMPSTESGGLPTWLFWFGGLWLLVGSLYLGYYKDERGPLAFLKVGALLGTIFTIAIGGTTLIGMLPPTLGRYALIAVVLAILVFVLYKLGDRIGTITELITAFVARGHWYLMPLVVILLTVGSLLVVAATSPLVAPFIYTLF